MQRCTFGVAICVLAITFPTWGAEGLLTHTEQDLSTSPEIIAKQPVLVLYTGDIAAGFDSKFDRNLRRILDTLALPAGSSSPDDLFLARVRDFILFDLETLSRGTDREISALRIELRKPNALRKLGIASFRNSGNEFGQPSDQFDWRMFFCWETFHPERFDDSQVKSFDRRLWELTTLRQLGATPQYASQLTNSCKVFKDMMEQLRNEFPPDKHRYILFIKGRGDAEHLLTLQYPFDAKSVDREKLRASFLVAKNKFMFADEPPEQFVFRANLSTVVHDVLSDVLPRFPPLPGDANKDPAGLTKKDFLEILYNEGKGTNPLLGMYFSRVVIHTTHGGFWNLPKA